MPQTVYLFDLWMTLVYGLTTDPILTLQEQLGHGVREGETTQLQDDFLNTCLTTNIADEREFLRNVARSYDIRLNKKHHRQFRELLALEQEKVTLYPETIAVLTELKARGARIGLISNLWPFPVRRVFEELDLGVYFEHLIYSFAVGSRKPNGLIFQNACQRFNVSPAQCIMVGDSLNSDIAGATNAGMSAVFVNRSGKRFAIPAGVREIGSLTELL